MSGKPKQHNESDSKTNKKKKSTKAQSEAARNNGAKSKGPVSEAGKHNSRQNALKHGLTAKFLTPARDPRNQDQLYQEVHDELINEYKPVGFTAESTVSNLAHDYVQMIRCRQMMEALQKPTALSQKDHEEWEKMQRLQRRRQALSSTIASITANDDLSFSSEVAHDLAVQVTGLVNEITKDIREINEEAKSYDPDTGAELVPLSDEEIEEAQELWRTIQPLRRQLADEEHLTRVFAGNAVPTKMLSKRLKTLLEKLQEYSVLRDKRRELDVEQKINALNESILMKLASEPERIMLLERYLRDIERSIERKMKQLGELQSLGSFRENDE